MGDSDMGKDDSDMGKGGKDDSDMGKGGKDDSGKGGKGEDGFQACSDIDQMMGSKAQKKKACGELVLIPPCKFNGKKEKCQVMKAKDYCSLQDDVLDCLVHG